MTPSWKKSMVVDFFYVPGRSKSTLGDRSWDEFWNDPTNQELIKEQTCSMPLDSTLDDLLAKGEELFRAKGSSRVGIFQIQTDLGVWDHEKGHRNLRTRGARFRSWEELETAEKVFA